jgi:hypothetical protein
MLARLLVLAAAQKMISVWEGDILVETEIFFNNEVLYTDEGVQIYPLNSNKIVTVSDNAEIRRITIEKQMKPGDIIAVKGRDYRPRIIPVDLDHYVQNYTRRGGFIGAIDNAVITSSEWLCSSSAQWQADPRWRGPLDPQETGPTSTWRPAYAYTDDSCCPWRDEVRAWEGLGAQWIWSVELDAQVVYCRYVMPPYSEPLGGFAGIAPGIVVDKIAVSQAVTSVDLYFDIDDDHQGHLPFEVACHMYREDVMLRAPLAFEVMAKGGSVTIEAIMERTFVDISTKGQNTRQKFQIHNSGTAAWLRLEGENRTLDYCQGVCETMNQAVDKSCIGLTFWDMGGYGQYNCRIMNTTFPDDTEYQTGNPSDTLIFHQEVDWAKKVHSIQLADKLFPGTLYGLFCATPESAWSEVKLTENLVRTAGCFDCGIKPYPVVTYRGGFLDNSKIGLTMDMSKAGVVQCLAIVSNLNATNVTTTEGNATDSELTVQAFQSSRSQASATTAEQVQVVIQDLMSNTPYAVRCRTEDTAGGYMPWEDVMADVHLVTTGNDTSPMYTLKVQTNSWVGPPASKDMIATFRLSTDGSVWCKAASMDTIMRYGAPTYDMIKDTGLFMSVTVPHADRSLPIISLDQAGQFPLDPEQEYESWCTAQTMAGDAGEGRTPYPNAAINDVEIFADRFIVEVRIDRKGNISCIPLRWPIAFNPGQQVPLPPAPWRDENFVYEVNVAPTAEWHPDPNERLPLDEVWSFVRPETPSPLQVRNEAGEGGRAIVEAFIGGTAFLTLQPLPSGTPFDIFCYAEDIFRAGRKSYGMPYDDVFKTRVTRRTTGPLWTEAECATGQLCAIDGVAGVGLGSDARIMVRKHCRPCACSGEPDYNGVGYACTRIPIDPYTMGPPQQPWCYTKEYACPDEARHPTTQRTYSILACDEGEALGLVEGFGPDAVNTITSVNGSSYAWNPYRVRAYADVYALCWCKEGCEGGRSVLRNFDLRIGNLYVTGPAIGQVEAEHKCQSGEICPIVMTKSIAIRHNDSLIALDKPCDYVALGPAENPIANGYPGFARTADGNMFTWSERIRPGGGTYYLCYCGVGKGHQAQPSDCDTFILGPTFTAGVGVLDIQGPHTGHKVRCRFGFPCTINLKGVGIQAGDQAQILSDCGVPEDNTRYLVENYVPSDQITYVGVFVKWHKAKQPTLLPDDWPRYLALQSKLLHGFRNPSLTSSVVGEFAFEPRVTPVLQPYSVCWRSLYSPATAWTPGPTSSTRGPSSSAGHSSCATPCRSSSASWRSRASSGTWPGCSRTATSSLPRPAGTSSRTPSRSASGSVEGRARWASRGAASARRPTTTGSPSPGVWRPSLRGAGGTTSAGAATTRTASARATS